MPIVPGRYDRASHTGWIVFQDVEVPVTMRRHADRIAANYGETIDWTGCKWPHDVTPAAGAMDAFARVAWAADELVHAVTAYRALGQRAGQDTVTRLLERLGQQIGDV